MNTWTACAPFVWLETMERRIAAIEARQKEAAMEKAGVCQRKSPTGFRKRACGKI